MHIRVLQGSVWGPLLFLVFIKDIQDSYFKNKVLNYSLMMSKFFIKEIKTLFKHAHDYSKLAGMFFPDYSRFSKPKFSKIP